eukprot:9501920-Pyramimonas_sp.AAC.1
MSTGMGFPAHSSGHAPCVLCKTSHDAMLTHNISEPLEYHGPGDYDAECQKHEMWKFIPNAAMHRKVRFRLEFKSTFRGRALNEPIPELGLLKGDR